MRAPSIISSSRSTGMCSPTQRYSVNQGPMLRYGLGKQSPSFDLARQRASIFSFPSKTSLRISNKNLTITAAQAPPAQPSKSNTPNKRKHAVVPAVLETNTIWSTLFSRLAKAAALLALAAAIALGGPRPAEAARSGGRMGGASFGRAMYGGSMYGSSFGSSKRSSLGSGSSSFGGVGGFGGRSASSGLFPYRSSLSTNAFFFSPFGMGMGYGYPMGGGGGGLLSLVFWGIFAASMISIVRGVLNNQNGGGSSEYIGSSSSSRGRVDRGERLSVAKVQVGLLGTARDLQKDLERIASKADTSSSRGLHYVLQETVLSLMRNPNYCVYGFAKSGVENSADEAESRFNKLSLEERGKFEKETRVNVSGRTGTSSLNVKKTLTTPVNELIVVTILVAVEGRVKLPKVTGRNQLIEALTTLGAVPAADVLAVEVLWTPEEEDDYFTQEDLANDYPLLNTL